MAVEVTMPRLSDSMEEGTILKWLKSVGEEVTAGEELVEIETDKANMTYEADTAGVLIEIVAAEGETLPIGEVIARIGEAGETETGGKGRAGVEAGASGEGRTGVDPALRPDSREADPRPPSDSPPEQTALREAGNADGRVKASPLARRIAREKSLDLAAIAGSGPGGRIVKADVEAVVSGQVSALSPQASGLAPATGPALDRPVERSRETGPSSVETAKGEATLEELTKLQQTVARRMAESKATAPHFYLSMEVDMSQAVALRSKLKELAQGDTILPSFNDMVVKASARALRDHPRANGAYRDGRLELYSRVNVGVAVAAQDALVVPTVFDADQRSLGDIARTARELIARVRDGTITPPELSGGTFTVSNLGMFGIESFAAVINPPQAAILAVGALKKKAVVAESGEIEPRDMMNVTLACDHRILYGAEGAEFLGRIRELLEEPFSLAL